jgi:hypothetical protein
MSCNMILGSSGSLEKEEEEQQRLGGAQSRR